ncbi:hypothetical protein JW711_03495 [Candidatus Woesearchaeota archaeon]|nr:hypothetical protein [Candidatus Woesearchaeota archaeon]
MPMILVLTLSLAEAALYVNVVTDEFSIESPYPVQSVKTCQCGLRTEVVEITNLGDFTTLFDVELFSPMSQYITLSRGSFSLKPGEATKIHVYIDAPCDLPISSFYVVQVSTNYGRSKELYKEFTSQKCQNIKFESSMLNDTIYPGEEAQLEIELQNVAEFTDTFKIVPTNNLPYAWISRDSVTLEPDEKTAVVIHTTLPLGSYGEVEQAFSIESEKGKNSAFGSEKYEIVKDYDFAIQTEDFKVDACEDVLNKQVIMFKNLARTPNEYYLSLKAPYFVNLSQYSLTLDGEEEDAIVMNVAPSQADIGKYTVILEARTKFGDVVKTKTFDLNVKDCFESSADISESGHVKDQSCTGEKEYELRIVNKGLYEEAYQIEVDSEGWLSVSEDNEFVRLRPAQEVIVPIKAVLPPVDETKTSFVLVKQLRAPYQTHEIRLDIESLSERTCYNVDLIQQTYEINYETPVIPLLLKHTGLKGGEYSLELGELDSKFVSLEEDTVTFEPGEFKVIHITPTNQSAYKTGTYLNKLSLTIKPTDKTIDYDRQFWIVLKDKSFLSKAWSYIKNFNYTRIGVCGAIGVILFVIALTLAVLAAGMKSNKDLKIKRIKASRIKNLKVLNIIMTALILAGLVFLIFMGTPDETRFYDQGSNQTGPLFHEWKQNTAYKLNLDYYFTDPDMDVLVYTASQPDHIQIRIEGSIATLTPEHGWSGEENVVFTASDEKGGITDSDVMTLSVVKKNPMDFFDYWSLYCKQVNIVLMMVILALLLVITDVVEERGYRRYLPRR